MTAEERRIIDAARAWAKAERDLRNANDARETWSYVTPERWRRVVVAADWTEQMLLDACEESGPGVSGKDGGAGHE